MLAGAFAGMGVQATGYLGATVKANALTTGDTFEMGMYPQSEVKDSSLINELSKITCEMQSYGYMRNSNSETHTYDSVDMSYADIVYGGEAYRKVEINEYRPYWTDYSADWGDIEEYTEQINNGYPVGNTYYFKWEPIVWQVLAKENDGLYVMSKTLLDSQSYHNFWEGITWENSSLRAWLNDDFYNAAFSKNEKDKINTITHANENSPWDSEINGGNDTTDNVWIISYSDAVNTAYGFSSGLYTDNAARRAQGSDYAKSQGLWVNNYDESEYYGDSYWWLRSPGDDSGDACGVGDGGCANGSDGVSFASDGVRPALKINLQSEIGKSDAAASRLPGGLVCAHAQTEIRNAKDATCTEEGYTGDVYCAACGAEIQAGKAIPAAGHNFGWRITKLAKPGENGLKEEICSVCGERTGETKHIEYTGHVTGDISNDGEVNNKDAARMFKYLSGWEVSINAAALDIDSDGKVDNRDLIRLFQYLSGWNVEIY